ncbi:electron transport complex subunit RsxE [Fusibacter sp. JL216-2]|uniref:electron transport complex subunit RsxE n=1 Tax=Fusibacter sp. JL216-2 TaxID=3071453 RepID=UPI003D3542AF
MKLKTLTNGLFKDNPVFYQMLGMCPTLAVTTSAENGMGMGLATTAVLVLANIVISLMRNFIPSKIRIPAFIVVIATFVTIVGMVMEGFVPALFASLGLFIPLIVVNCLILARAEAFAFKNGVLDSALDGIGMGLGFTLALTVLGAVREIFGAGAIFGITLFGEAFEPALIMILPPGAFLALGLILAGINAYQAKKAKALASQKAA